MAIELFSGVFVPETPAEEAPVEDQPAAPSQVDYSDIAARQRVDLLAHLRSLRNQLREAHSFVQRARHKLQTEAQASADGVTLLQVRNHCLLEYLGALAQFGMAKTAGLPVADAVDSLVTNRCVIERTKPLIQQMRYQLQKYDELEKSAGASILRANPDAMVPTQEPPDRLVAAQYQAPRIMANLYPNAADDSAKAANFARTVRAHTKQSVLMEEAADEIRDEPLEAGRRAAQSRRVRDFMRRIKEREVLEEDMMQRLPMTKKDRQMMRDVERMQGSLDAIMDYERQPKQKQKARPPQKKHVRRKR